MDLSEVPFSDSRRRRQDRRSRLRQLDDLLEALEVLNLRERELPDLVRQRLEIEGISYSGGAPIGQLIDQVLDLQQQYLIRIKGRRWDLVDE